MEYAQKLFGKKTSPDEMVKKWQRDIRTQQRIIERQIREFGDVEKKTTNLLKQNAKKNDVKACKLFAKELVRTRRQIVRLHTSKAQLNSIQLQLQHQLATLKITGSLNKSVEVMKMVNGLTKLPEISKGMQELSVEMTKAGILDEMIEDTFESFEDSDIEEEAEEEVNKVLFELTDGLIGEAGEVGKPLELKVEEEEEEPELNEMQARLQALKS
ncbi:26457_t:CDS:2 [Gigaspora margarita]|uniref:Charged multivesicular body protein 3 n=2 Tax=Gigaspora margarita TaxID=4874 RepID=A0A8H4AI75_GIGMA|nr:Charged multivesicular body protein 3 [Gigaspora margarita]CAG8805985.1 26457_t:CDS:2 [Gigaspora margarita]